MEPLLACTLKVRFPVCELHKVDDLETGAARGVACANEMAVLFGAAAAQPLLAPAVAAPATGRD